MKSERFSRIYVSSALLLVNTLVIFLVVNALAYPILFLYEFSPEADPVTEKYGEERLRMVYPHLTADEIRELLHETWSRSFVYEPFTQFSERPYQGKYVNVDSNGFRVSKDQAAWPPPAGDINIFLFGGSTTFGYGVEDSQTIASHLQESMRNSLHRGVNVYNFGRGFYYSTQERILFEALLASGHVPELAVFIDGLNDFYHHDGNPLFTESLGRFVSGEIRKITFFSKLPVTRLFHALLGDNGKGSSATPGGHPGNVRHDDPEVLGGVIARYFENKKIIEAVAASYGVKPVFVWQPVPTFNYDDSHHPFAGPDSERHMFSRYGYPLMKSYTDDHAQGANFLWAADLQQDHRRPLYVDQVHYTGEFSRQLADFIAGHLVKNYF
jgi:hypothetical protein